MESARAPNHSADTTSVINDTSAGDHLATRDSLLAGSDVLSGNTGSDIVFGDHGVIDMYESFAGATRQP